MKLITKFVFATMLTTFSIASVFASDNEIEALTDAEALAVDAKFYAESYGVSEEEAMRRLLIMTDSWESIDQIKNEYGSRISGLYFDNSSSDFGLKVNLVGDDTPVDKILLRKGKPEKVEKNKDKVKGNLKKLGLSEGTVEKAKDKISKNTEAKVSFKGKAKFNKNTRLDKLEKAKQRLFAKLPYLELVADDERTGSATLYVKQDDGTTKEIAEKILDIPVQVEIIPSGIVQTHTRGGSKIVNSSGNLHCMTGFVAKNTSGQEGVLTAGHCVVGNPSLFYTDKDGSKYPLTTVSSVFDGRADIAFVTANHAASAGQFYADNTSTPRTLSGTMSRVNTRVAKSTVPGSYICHLGQISKTDSTLIQSCGEVSSTSGQGSDGVGGNTYVVVKNTKKGGGTTYDPATDGVGTMRCISGDSGGPWFANTIGYGIQSGCAWVDANTQKQAKIVIYTSLDYSNLVGATVVTK